MRQPRREKVALAGPALVLDVDDHEQSAVGSGNPNRVDEGHGGELPPLPREPPFGRELVAVQLRDSALEAG